MLHREHHISDDMLAFLRHHIDRAVDHHIDELVVVYLADRQSVNGLAVAQNRDIVADLKNLLQTVGEVDDGLALLLQIFNVLHQFGDFAVAQAGRWLVHDDDLCVF